MNIGIIGIGTIGKTLARTLQAAGHQVRIANSRGPESLQSFAQQTGTTATTVEQAVQGAEVIILSIPLGRLPAITHVLEGLPPEVIVVETMNYYPGRDGTITEIEQGLVNSAWVAHTIGHPVVKAFNNIGAYSLATAGTPAGTPGRIALPVAGDDAAAKQVVLTLVDQVGFDGYDAGSLAESWRQQPGTPAYGPDLPVAESQAARSRAVREESLANQAAIGQQIVDLGEENMQIVLSGEYPAGFVDRSVDLVRAYFNLPPRAQA